MMATGSKQYFDDLGADWDGLQESFFSDRVRIRAFEVAQIKAGRLAVDLGAGTGFITGGLLESGLRVVAVDQSAAMLEALRAKFPDADGLDCRTADAERLPIDDETADYCFANMCLHHVENPSRTIREMARVLKPGGALVITDLDSHEHEFLRTEHHDRWMGFERDDLRNWYQAAGLEEVRVEGIDQDCCTTSHEGSSVAISIFLASATKPQ